MPQLDLGSVLGPQGPKGDPGNQGTVGPRGPQGEQGDAGKDATINGVNALTIETGDGLEATMTGSAYNLKLTDNTLNAVRVVPTFTRPNLLDNWYFGRPVNQRGGKIIQQGVAIYSDSALKTLIGPAAYACPVVELTSTYAKVQDAKNTSSYYYAAPADVVRGYTGNGYTVDRWLIGAGSNGTLQLTESVLKITRTDGPMYLAHRILKTQIPEGSTLTYSVLTTSGLFSISFVVKNDTYHEQSVGGGISLGWNYTPAEIMELTLVNNTVNSDVTIKAVKLELGPTQTLAHQENGVWVLNEVPEYGEQLRRCQRYHYQVHYNQYETIGFAYDGPEYAFIILPLPTEMRGETPTLKIIGDISIGGKVRTLTGCNCHGCEAIIGVNYTAQPSSAGATYAYSTSAGGVTISIIYDL